MELSFLVLPGTAELQLGICPADTFRTTLEWKGGNRIEDLSVTEASERNAELELGGPMGRTS